MDDETKPPFPPATTTLSVPVEVKTTDPVSTKDSKMFGVSLRGLIVLIVVMTVCVMSFLTKKIEEPLYTLVGLTVGYYFGQTQKLQSK